MPIFDFLHVSVCLCRSRKKEVGEYLFEGSNAVQLDEIRGLEYVNYGTEKLPIYLYTEKETVDGPATLLHV